MGDGRLGIVGDARTGLDGVDVGGSLAGVALVAADLIRVDVRDGAVALEVCRGPDNRPVGRVGNAGEGVCCCQCGWPITKGGVD
jgi:hypothetical protein